MSCPDLARILVVVLRLMLSPDCVLDVPCRSSIRCYQLKLSVKGTVDR